MRRVYIDISNPENTESKVRIRKWKGARSLLIKKNNNRFVDPLLFIARKIFMNAKFDIVFGDIRKTNALGQRNN